MTKTLLLFIHKNEWKKKFIFIHSQYSIQREIFVCRFRILRDHLFLLNHQLTPETLQIQDCYSLIRFLHLFQIYVAIFTYVPFLSYESTSLMTDKYMSQHPNTAYIFF